ncbi:pali-domain-containing protein [Hypoxylon rubiginosum]|uniref:Pali-domain-containing protein n=1 Tax=Hypoxylon rubiginosum TaxID=110542 RepID=A0ACC0CPX7_9PEZI|nr:pali-domain-containing protein [Hypoxylon rubiginosum]
MKQTGFFHHIGSFLLLVATVLLVITTISAPVVNSISMLKVNLYNQASGDRNPTVTFGTFGYCVTDALSDGGDVCSGKHIGYDPIAVVKSNVDNVDFSNLSADTSKGLTRVMVLHPVAAGLSFIAFLLALGAGVLGSLLASLVSLVTFIVTLVVLVTDFVCFAIIRNEVNNASNSNGARAEWGAATWTMLVAAICNLLATVIVFFTCCSTRMHRRRETRRAKDVPEGYGTPVRQRRRRFW